MGLNLATPCRAPSGRAVFPPICPVRLYLRARAVTFLLFHVRFSSARMALLYAWCSLLVAGVCALPALLALLGALCPYLLQDCAYMLRAARFGLRLERYKRTARFYSILDCFLDAVRKHPHKPFIHFTGETHSYSDVDRESNKVARALQEVAGLKQGDVVALFLGNDPRFIWIWLGLAKLGCASALLNFNIRSKSLLHCFSCCGANVLVVDEGKSFIH